MRAPRQRDGAARPRTSLKEIARATGFSVSTVSTVLNGRADEFHLARRTRDLILAVAEDRGYHPNVHARSLRSGATNILGLIVPTLENPFFSEMAETFERLARRSKKLALITVSHHDPGEELETAGWFLAQKVECIFTANPMALAALSALCGRAGTRHIVLDAQASAEQTVTTDNAGAGLVLTRHLLASLAAAGRPGRVYYIGGMAEHAITQQRLAGFRAALRERGLGFSREQFIPTQFDPESAHRAVEALFAARDDVGGLFVNSLPALGGLARYFPQAADRCSRVHYAVFDHHPIMSLLHDLRAIIVKQYPDRMMEKAFGLFEGGAAGAPGPVHHVPYDLVVTPSMRPYLPVAEGGAPVQGPARPAPRRRGRRTAG